MVVPTGAVVCGRADGLNWPIERFSLERLSDQSAPTLVGAGRARDAGRADVGLALNLCLSNQFL